MLRQVQDYAPAVLLLAFLLTACGGSAVAEMPVRPELTNRDFAAPLDSGWHRQVRNFDGRGDVIALPEGGVTVSKTFCGWYRLSQAVVLDDFRQTFRTRARFAARSSRHDYFGRSGLTLGYLDADGGLLGETRWYLQAGGRPEENSPTRHSIRLTEAGQWLDLELDIADELRRNLSGVRPADVRALRITFEAFGSGTGGC